MEFCQALQEVMRQVPVRGMVLVMGDCNARVGNDVETWCGTLSRFGPLSKMRMVFSCWISVL